MLQAIVKKGKVLAETIPAPKVSEGSVLIRVVNSCISAGTEMTSVSNSKKSLIKRALEQPDEVKTALKFAKENGIKKMIERVKGVLDSGKPTGYSISGIIVDPGSSKLFSLGDHVAAAGAGIANHAEYVNVPTNLVMKMPKDLGFQEASTVTMGGIAMQGVRRADLNLGEICVIQGAGILGLLAQQMLQTAGIRVIVIDLDSKRLEIANKLGAELVLDPTKDDIIKHVQNLSNGYGADAVIFTAATSSNEPLSQAFKMCKRKGKVVLVGVSGMNINRGDIYKKELDFAISTSYGPGRYDGNYEEKGQDYPYAYVRWTENRNMTEYLRLLNDGKIDISSMINSTFPIEKVDLAFEQLKNKDGETPIIIILDYGYSSDDTFTAKPKMFKQKTSNKKAFTNGINVALIGAGSFATGMHLPNLKTLSKTFNIHAIATRTGQKAKAIAEQYGASYATTDINEILNDSEVNLVMISTQHDSHGSLVIDALKAGKNVFVEKPLCTTQEELDVIKQFFKNAQNPPMLMVGFNRRFSKYAQEIKKHTAKRINPLLIEYRMNAGFIPLDHWTHEHGGRIVGELCHIIDLMTFFTESKISSISIEHLSPKTGKFSKNDNQAIILKYKDGSICTLHYFAIGSKKMSKEYMEIHFDEKSIVMDDYKTLIGYDVSLKEYSNSKSKKGQLEELSYIKKCLIDGEEWPIALWDMIQTTEISFAVANN